MSAPIARLPKVRSKAIMASANGQTCALRVSSFVPGHRCASDDTVVYCHLPGDGKGMGTKVSDLVGAYGCAHCHDIVDRRDKVRWDYIYDNYPTAYVARLLSAMQETQARLVEQGLMTGPDWRIV